MDGNEDPENHLSSAGIRAQIATLLEWDAVRVGKREFESKPGNPTSHQVDAFLQGKRHLGSVQRVQESRTRDVRLKALHLCEHRVPPKKV